MHALCEIVMPKVDDIEKAVEQIMAPFSENVPEDDGYPSFWDWWVIGGRYSGVKLEASLDQEKLKAFQDELNNMNITVSGLQCGKQEIKPSDQIPKVDALWKQYFPDCGFDKCPLFGHSNDQYSNDSSIPGDIMDYSKIPLDMKCCRVIVAGLDYEDKDLEAKFMIEDEFWNGVNHSHTNWDRTLKDALSMFKKSLEHYREGYAEKITPTDDWMVVSVDYHT